VTVHREHKVKRENQQDATNLMFIIKLLSQHVSGIIMPIIRRTRPCPTACGVLPGSLGCGSLRFAVVLWSCALSCVHAAHDAALVRVHLVGSLSSPYV